MKSRIPANCPIFTASDSDPVLNRGRSIRAAITAMMMVGGAVAVRAAPPAEKPNILIFLSDDQGWNDVGWHNPMVKTPQLDRICRESLRLDQQYVCPMCTPTRAALMTGRFPTRFGISDAQNEQALRIGTVTMASALKEAGYDTALIGKWHLGSSADWGPQHFGFDYSYGSLAGGCGPYSHLYKAGKFAHTWHRNGSLIADEGHVTDLIGREAVQWLESRGDRPFFLYVPFTAPHVPIKEPQVFLDANLAFEIPAKREYYASVTHMDNIIGQVMTALERSGKRGNTVVLFLSDNGATPEERNETWLTSSDPRDQYTPGPAGGSNYPLRGRKTQVYEGGLRVPAFISWPGHLKPGVYDGAIHVADWMPTLMHLAGYRPKADLKWDGRNIWPDIISGRTVPRQLYWVSSRYAQLAVRDGDWKLIISRKDNAAELFNLATDPNEQTNFAAQQPKRIAAMRDLMARLSAHDNDAKVGDVKTE